MKKSSPKIYVIIVTYNGVKWIDQCVGQLRSSTIPLTPIVIDNHSTDETVAYIEKNYPETILLKSTTNLGFAKANNLGMRKALELNCDYVFLLNQDAWIKEETIQNLIEFAKQNENYGILSPIHLNGKGDRIDDKFAYELFTQNYTFMSDLFFNRLKVNYDCSFLNAAAWLLPVNTLKTIGGFDEFYFMYGEDTDYTKRVLFHGLKITAVSNAEVLHARDNTYYKKSSFLKSIKFHSNEWKYWSYQEFTDFNRGYISGIINAFKRMFETFFDALFYRNFALAIGTFSGWIIFLFHIKKANQVKSKTKNIKTSHFLTP